MQEVVDGLGAEHDGSSSSGTVSEATGGQTSFHALRSGVAPDAVARDLII